MNKLMNDTKWDEVRLAMYGLGKHAPKWRTKDVESGYISDWDSEWFYHFREGGYKSIEWVEMSTPNEGQRKVVLAALKKVRVPGHSTESGFKVYGYIVCGQAIDFIDN